MKSDELMEKKNFVIRPVHDIGFKALMGHKLDPENFLIKDFLKALFQKEFEVIEFKDREITPVQLLGKTIRLDLSLKCDGMQFNLEMQMIPTGSEAERALYYACVSIADQQLEGISYNMLTSVHQVFLMAKNSAKFLYPVEHYGLIDSEHGQTLTEKLKISMISLERIVKEAPDIHQMNDLQKWCTFFCYGHQRDNEVMIQLLKEERFRKADMIMRTVNQDQELKDAAFQRMKDHIDMVTRMENMMEYAKKEGHAQGHAQGLVEGHAEGHAQGLAEGHAEGHAEGVLYEKQNVIQRLNKMEFSIEQIAAAVEMNVSDVRNVLELFKNNK